MGGFIGEAEKPAPTWVCPVCGWTNPERDALRISVGSEPPTLHCPACYARQLRVLVPILRRKE